MTGIVSNITKTLYDANGTITEPNVEAIQMSVESLAITSTSLVVMALVPVYFGSFRSAKLCVQNNLNKELLFCMTTKVALAFPVVSSLVLFSLYIGFKVFSKESINKLTTYEFYVFGVAALSKIFCTKFSAVMPKCIPKIKYEYQFIKGILVSKIHFTLHDVLCFSLCATIGSLYLYSKHWIINNLFGLAFATNGIEFLHINNIRIGCLLLCGLCFYDVFWVFGTDVMVTVAESFDVPNKLLLPKDILENGILDANNFAMLGLGDIVIPGIFIAFLLRFDQSLKRKTNVYFKATFLAYFLGLFTTMFIVYIFKTPQPALLYLVPVCLITPMLVAVMSGDLKALVSYEDYNLEPENSSEKSE